jgi:hypothetical protein
MLQQAMWTVVSAFAHGPAFDQQGLPTRNQGIQGFASKTRIGTGLK